LAKTSNLKFGSMENTFVNPKFLISCFRNAAKNLLETGVDPEKLKEMVDEYVAERVIDG
jgi:hypothetical protein